MEGGNEQRGAKKFCFKAGLSATKTLVLVQKLMRMRLLIDHIFDFETDGSWKKVSRDVAVQNRLEI